MPARTDQSKRLARFNIQDALTVGDVAKIHGVDSMTVRRWIRAGYLPSYNIGKITFIRADALEALQASGVPR